jgi:hypothetical protein
MGLVARRPTAANRRTSSVSQSWLDFDAVAGNRRVEWPSAGLEACRATSWSPVFDLAKPITVDPLM